MARKTTKVAILGAGSIGCFVGGALAARSLRSPETDLEVVFVGRARMKAVLDREGLKLSGFDGFSSQIAPSQFRYDTDPSAARDCDWILVAVKSLQTSEAARSIRAHLRPNARVVSLQNGLRNAEILRAELPGHEVYGGMVPFNVAETAPGTFHRGTSGDLLIERPQAVSGPSLLALESLTALLTQAGVSARLDSNLPAVLWGKLLLNLNNPINALSGLPLKAELSDRRYRRLLAGCIREALIALRAARIKPTSPVPVPLWLLPGVLRLPNFLFTRVARRMIAIDPQARSSMADDLRLGRKTEIEQITGEVVALARKHGTSATLNERVVREIRNVEAGGVGSLDDLLGP